MLETLKNNWRHRKLKTVYLLTLALFAVLITPLMWLGCTLFPWSALHVIPWVQDLALADPLTYASEGLRAAVTSQPVASTGAPPAARASAMTRSSGWTLTGPPWPN